MSALEYNNFDLYRGLEAVLDNPNCNYQIEFNGITYTKAEIDKEKSQIILSNSSLNATAKMDINVFAGLQQQGWIKFNVT